MELQLARGNACMDDLRFDGRSSNSKMDLSVYRNCLIRPASGMLELYVTSAIPVIELSDLLENTHRTVKL